jgi:hypothetical protein
MKKINPILAASILLLSVSVQAKQSPNNASQNAAQNTDTSASVSSVFDLSMLGVFEYTVGKGGDDARRKRHKKEKKKRKKERKKYEKKVRKRAEIEYNHRHTPSKWR